MCIIHTFIGNLYDIIIGKNLSEGETLIKIHTRSLEDIGDISFPLSMDKWYHSVRNNENESILSYKIGERDIEKGLNRITEELEGCAKIQKYTVIKNSAHFFFDRSLMIFHGIKKVFLETNSYGKCNSNLLSKNIKFLIDDKINIKNLNDIDLTTLRLLIIKDVAENLIKFLLTSEKQQNVIVMFLRLNAQNDDALNILCGPVMNENGIKDHQNIASYLFDKRASDMRMMAQHRYHVNVKPNSEWNEYFLRLGTASVIIEMLSNKPHKSIKVSLNDLRAANKGPSFIFYNCARLSVLLNEFDNKVRSGVYPELPELDKLDFKLLTQPEEWELMYVYILQFPRVLKNCIRGIEKGMLNPQHLIAFLSHLSSVFSTYYRRIRILTDPRDHLFGIIHSRICLLKALQYVFHNSLRILNIEPVKEM